MAKSFKQKITDKLLSLVPDNRVRVEAALRSTKKGKTLSGEIKRSSVLFQAKNLKDWKDAIALATDGENPDFILLAELYQNLLLDGHTMSVIESRVMRVLRSKFVLVTENGDDVPELKKLFERPWFEEFLKQALLSKFTGVKVLELFDLDDNLELTDVTLIPLEHTKPNKGIIIQNAGDDKGWNYKEGNLSRFYIQIGKDTDLGMLSDLAPLILAKKMSMGAWLDWIEKYGIAMRYAITDNMTTDRQEELFDMLMSSISNQVAVLQGKEQIVISDTPNTDSYKVFLEFLKYLDNSISKRVLGQTMTTEDGSSRSQAEVHEKVANDRHESDKLFAQYIINKVLIPKLLEISSFYSPLQGITFDWDESEQMATDTFIDKAVALSGAGFELDYKLLAEKSGMPIIGFSKIISEPIVKENAPKKKSQ